MLSVEVKERNDNWTVAGDSFGRPERFLLYPLSALRNAYHTLQRDSHWGILLWI